ncbi:MAG TPA: S8 family peptidase [Thermoanaerobaculia bacterium]|nr:S8 family peptidase [Thermoanaerobaculia bacterium]
MPDKPVYLDRWLIDQLMFGSGRVRRFTQDSPVLPDVWLEYAIDPNNFPQRLTRRTSETDPRPAVNLLLSPYREARIGEVQQILREHVAITRAKGSWNIAHDPNARLRIVYNQSTIAATLYFEDLVRAVIPMTQWWKKLADKFELDNLQKAEVRANLAKAVVDPEHTTSNAGLPKVPPDVLWLIRVVGAIALVHRGKTLPPVFLDKERGPARAGEEDWRVLVDEVGELMSGVHERDVPPLIHSIALNRVATPTIAGSRKAVKADAAERVFGISCKEITWAIIDSGVDAAHPAFRIDKPKKKSGAAGSQPAESDVPFASYDSRVRQTYDFAKIQQLLDPDENIDSLVEGKSVTGAELKKHTDRLSDALSTGMSIDWGIIAPLLKIPHDATYKPPKFDHGTHVAGILGGNWKSDDEEGNINGVCPDINLYDLRILDDDGRGDEFTVMAALQFVRWLNSTNDYMAVHGVNMSLSIPHDVANYACGRTPVCEEAERVVSSGVVVVVAAGNQGYRRTTIEGVTNESYNTISITDPGNADLVITVGATHRERPHTYGVSYFSSRGPTGDGRLKPDLVAPGEKIMSALPNASYGVKDGTSMAAPHVSGAAALLMARYDELVGRPMRIKQILRDSATDLGRERYFQGAGMLDILRALQSV